MNWLHHQVSLWIVALGTAILLLGCAGPLDGANRSLASISQLSDRVVPVLEKQYGAEEAACLQAPKAADQAACVDQVNVRWRPVKRAVRSVRLSWLLADAALRVAEARAAAGGKVDAAGVLVLVAKVMTEAETLTSVMAAVQSIAEVR